MKLLDLNPKWITPNYMSDMYPLYIGVKFDCPHCGKKLVVGFHPAINKIENQFLNDFPKLQSMDWTRVSGDDFDNITLSPSVDFKGHWHGHITNGELTNA